MYNIEKVWKDWKIVRLIGEGSFGKVYEIVRNKYNIEEHSAMKVIEIPNSAAEVQSLQNEGMDQGSLREYYMSLVEDFSNEIALMAKLKGNPGIVAYEDYAVLEHEDKLGWDIIIRMELLTPIASITAKRELTEQEVIDMGVSLCDALSVCRKKNIIHRDIKIDNIFVSENGFYKLGDFGVARTIEKTAAGLSKKGTYTYMAPEVYRGSPYGHRADIYSLGMVMYRLLNYNREPFLPPPPENVKYADKNNALIMRMRGDRFNPPAKAGAALQKVIMKACEYDANDRFESAEEMKKALLAVKSNPDVIPDLGKPAGRSGQPRVESANNAVPNRQTPPVNPNAGYGQYQGYQNRAAVNSWQQPQSGCNGAYQVQGAQYYQPAKPPKSTALPATILAWVGLLVEILGIVATRSYTWINPPALLYIIIGSMALLAITVIIFTFKQYSKALWVIMFILSVVSLSIINIIATFLFYNDCFYKQSKK